MSRDRNVDVFGLWFASVAFLLLGAVGCTPASGGGAATTGGKSGSGGAKGTGGAASGTGGSTATGTGGANTATGGSTAGTGGSSTGTGGSNAGTGGSTVGTGGSDTGNGGSMPGTGGSAAGTGGSAAGTGGSAAGMGGSDTGTGGSSTGGAGGVGSALTCSLGGVNSAVVTATSDVISDFTYTDGTDNIKADNFSFGNFYDQASGYSFHYPLQATSGAGGAGGAGGQGGTSGTVPGLKEDFTGSNWHITGRVNTYAGFAVALTCVTDASAYLGVEFTIKGTAGSPNQLTVQAGIAGDDMATASTTTALCTGSTCQSPSVLVSVTSTATLVRLSWNQFTGGKPMASVNPAQLTGLRWTFAWTSSTTPYNVDVTIDNLHFTTASPDAGASDSSSGN